MYLSAPRAVMASFAHLFPDTTTLNPNSFAIGTAICPKLPEPPGMKRLSPGFAFSSSVMAS